jgi:cytidyltransferase-like protein
MALKKIRQVFQETNINAFQDLLKNRILVTEKIQGSSFHVRRNVERFEYFKSGDIRMNMIDRTIVGLYETGVKHIQSLDPSVKEEMPTDWKFGFDYLPELEISQYKYTKLPKNNLILTHIQTLSESGKVKKTIYDPSVLNKWAKKLEVQGPSIVFDGTLNQNQKTELINLLSMSDKEFVESFDYDRSTDFKTSFTQKIIKIFNPNQTSPILNEDFEVEIDGLIISFIDGKKVKSFKLEDFTRNNESNSKESSHMYQITIADLIEYLSSFDMNSVQLNEETADLRYIELMSVIFNKYVNENSTKFIGVNFESADFASHSVFKLNSKYIKNETTLSLVENEILSELFKITLGSFRKKRNKESDILNKEMIEHLNNIVEEIDKKIFVENTDENSIYDFNNFILHNKVKTSVNLNEALKVDHPEQGGELVNMFVGRFQPFTLGHAKVLETIHKENGYPVVVLLVKAKNKKKEDAFKRPYDEKTQIKMFKAVQKQYPFLKEIFVIPTGGIDTMFNAMRPKYEPVLWGTGSDRMKTYGFQVNKDSYREDLGVRSDFRLFEIPRTDDNISATQVRNAMLDGDEGLFKSTTPKALHKMYGELKKKLEDSVGTSESNEVAESLLTFKQFLENNG